MAVQGEHGARIISFPLERRRALEVGRARDAVRAGDEPGAECRDQRHTSEPAECMAELIAMLAADGADVVAFALRVPTRFRSRLPADLRLAAGLG